MKLPHRRQFLHLTVGAAALSAVSRIASAINAALADPKIKARLTDLGSSLHSGSPAEFGKFIADETEKWGKVIRAAGIKAE
jgi:tripartite-type tricarboxylate transporter receptor subunit TctC